MYVYAYLREALYVSCEDSVVLNIRIIDRHDQVSTIIISE